MKHQVKRFTDFVNEYHSHNHHLSDMEDSMSIEKSPCCDSDIDTDGYCTECGEYADQDDSYSHYDRQHKADPDNYLAAPPREIHLDPHELYEAKKKAQIEALKAVDKKFANLKPVGKKKSMPEEEEEMEEAPKKGGKAKPAAKEMPFGKKAEKPAAKGMPFGKKEEKPAAKGMPFGKPAAKQPKPFGFQKKGANTENEM